MQWDHALRGLAMLFILGAYVVYTRFGTSMTTLFLVIASVGTLAMPEFVDRLPFGPSKD